MDHNNFLISATPRSGTKFLSTVMNYSKKWSVIHESRFSGEYIIFDRIARSGRPNLSKLQNQFDCNYYGEVNSNLRDVLVSLKVNKVGVIIRNPRNIAKSIYNHFRKNKNKTSMEPKMFAQYLRSALSSLDYAINFNKDIKIIRFEKMTSDKEYLLEIFRYFGIDDYEPSDVDINTPINESLVILADSFNQMEDEYQTEVIKETNWFMEKYYGL